MDYSCVVWIEDSVAARTHFSLNVILFICQLIFNIQEKCLEGNTAHFLQAILSSIYDIKY